MIHSSGDWPRLTRISITETIRSKPTLKNRRFSGENDETIDALGEATRRELAQIETALEGLESGRYGICGGCGEPIAEARLTALPFAALCVSCAERAEGG